jgi:ComF family protein
MDPFSSRRPSPAFGSFRIAPLLRYNPPVSRVKWLDQLLDFCYPGACAICEGSAEGASPLCPACDETMRGSEAAPACGRCAMPLPEHDAPCPYCLGDGTKPYERVIRLGSFHDPLKELIHQIKYRGRWHLAEHLADRLLALERVKGLLTHTDVLVPVPLHRLRQIARGYNQAEVVARRLSKRCRIPLVRPVVRLRNTETQTHLHSHAKRMENLRDAFGLVAPKSVGGKHVVVLDDVRTTGATLQALARTLRPAKPASLSAIVLAVADPKGQDFEVI